MKRKLVVNASPIICLAKSGYIHILPEISEKFVVPESVVDEIQSGPVHDPARRFIETGRIEIVYPDLLPEVIAWDLGKGESSVLSFALSEPEFTAVIDDLAGRKCANSLNISVMGTISLVLVAKQMGVVTSAAQVIRALQAADLRIQPEIIRNVLKSGANEDF